MSSILLDNIASKTIENKHATLQGSRRSAILRMLNGAGPQKQLRSGQGWAAKYPQRTFDQQCNAINKSHHENKTAKLQDSLRNGMVADYACNALGYSF